MNGYLFDHEKVKCFGCEACVQICGHSAIEMITDKEGFRYPHINNEKCIHCNLCHKVCPYENMPSKNRDEKIAFGGFLKDKHIKEDSTSGGAFSAIVKAWHKTGYVVFGAEAHGLRVNHSFSFTVEDTARFRKSKYSQSSMNDMYKKVREFLLDKQNVLFSGTPCQIAGLKSFLMNIDQTNLTTVEVICEGVPSPLYMKKMNSDIKKTYGNEISFVDYRYKDKNKWDFEVMMLELENGKRFKKDRWFNPYWSIWLSHLMNRPSCYHCPFTSPDRLADITLGDLWGVHIYCPDLYGNNEGASLILANTSKGRELLENSKKYLYGHELDFDTALKYQSPLRKNIEYNPARELFMKDLMNDELNYRQIVKKWAQKPSIKLLFQKYIWGNRQKVFIWNLKNRK
ncbi:4Fe-4S dicluster domain-containing protein [Clostridiaceae bacterium DONG20-135]|uniref:4Fe-4S dicluster domain-containing protein n=1 Tax=Copranaerobaculum intestinale TaxID=2692629 RepID=A0A6N8U642_9FIRM|nr:Coenzyme F420 hydrogenase/dehydrogenase, beta subunit C-terminal domain [Copranaerobaculum intestinale]MXQ72975.1 4Fe-4S dicluster domain-containing protein [Copranaerobaculum intestinale]